MNDINEYEKFFSPNSISVIGASNDINKIGGYLLLQAKKAIEKVYPVNIKEDIVQDLKAYKRVCDITETIDLAVIAIPSNFVLDAVLDCIKINIKNIIIISAGFKETGEEGKSKEEKLKHLIKEHDLNIIGPNCLGILNPHKNFNCSFAKDIPILGDIALISQSGAVIDAIIDWSFKKKIGFSKIVSIGNMAGIDQYSILEYLSQDSQTKKIVFYMETLENGYEFAKLLRKVSINKPVIIIKPGNSENAQKAIGSHTGSLAQDNLLVEQLLVQNNGIFVKNLNELFNILIGLKANIPKGKKTVILTNAGGPGVIATDCLSETILELKQFDEKEKQIFSFLPDEASINNPIDMLGDAKSDRYEKSLIELNKLPEIDNIFILLTPQIMTDSLNIASSIVNINSMSQKCIFACFLGDKEIKEATTFFDNNNIASFDTPSDALNAINYLTKYSLYNHDEIFPDFQFNQNLITKNKEILENISGLLDYNLTKDILNSIGVNIIEKQIFLTHEDIDKAILEPNKIYVLKADSKDMIHKKEFGGVELNISTEIFKEKAHNMLNILSEQKSDVKLTLEEQVTGTQVIVGLSRKNDLGDFIMFGMGGTYVNIFKDVNFSSCPLSYEQAQRLVNLSKVSELLKGYRDLKPVDMEKLYDLIIRISNLTKCYPKIKEVDFNPIICSEKGIFLVDVKILI